MSRFYFDLDSGFVTADGALAKSGFEKDTDFALGIFCKNSKPLLACVCANPKKAVSDDVSVCDLGGSCYYLHADPVPEIPEESEVLFQTTCAAGGVTHLVTHCRRGEYRLVVETAEEIHEILSHYALSDIHVSAVTLKSGQIIRITAIAGGKKLIALLFYGGDYVPLFTKFCDDFYFDGSDVVYTEDLGGCNRCSRTRRMTYKNGSFCETEISFVYKRDHDYPDELLPYVFIEKLLFRDDNGAEELLRRGLSSAAAREILGDFDSIADFGFMPYRPYVAGVYKRAPYCKVRYFRFTVKDGLLCDIIPL